MKLEQKVEMHWRGVDGTQDGLTTKDDNVVEDNNTDGLVTVSQEGFIVDESEVLSWVSSNLFEDSREQGPQLKTEWVVN